MSQMSQISQGHGDWLVVEAPTERNELFHEDLFPHQRSYSWNMRKLLMSSDVNEITMKISSAWSVSRALCKAVCPSLLRRLTSAPCFRKTLLDATCQTDTIARRFRPQCQIFMLESFSHYCDIRRYKWKTKNCRIFVVQPVQHLLQSSWYPAHRRPWTEIHILAKGGLGGVGGEY